MKKIGEYTARGEVISTQMNLESFKKIELFDGNFDTAYVITKFQVFGVGIDVGEDNDVLGMLTTEQGSYTRFDGGDQRQIAWAFTNGFSYSRIDSIGNIIDRDNLVVEDLYVYGMSGDHATGTARPFNYIIEMDKYKITDWQGALAMVRNKSQDV